ncbi:hypothetical protein RD792_000764 [Penstemon davidsonii]|uniref:DIS3-like exonuclease 2 n=1 Tax=Penstemon davidsonii TaxID=160366 RepID=A0ABR0DLK7_9LAMI|nr:hypothetical protein RD792_000764 [Penstemon davidsonii]
MIFGFGAACSSASEMCMDEPSLLANHAMPNEHHEDQHQKQYNSGVSSIPSMYVNDETAARNNQNQQYFAHEISGVMFSISSPEPDVQVEQVEPVLITRQIDCRPKYFPPHWSTEAVSKLLEEGSLLRSIFRVNAYNRQEAYCKIDGVQTDVLIIGEDAQNRAIEGDTVAIIIDPPSSWPRMKGSIDAPNNSASRNLQQQEVLTHAQDSSKGKTKVNPECENVSSSKYSVFPENGTHYEKESSSGALSGNNHVNGVLDNGYYNDYQPSVSDSVDSLEDLCTLVSLLPSKRPTGRVVSVIERSLRRDNVVGFLSVNLWIFSPENKRKDFRKNKHKNNDYILLIPIDPKFTKMMIPVRNLPGSIKKRLESGDLTVETDLIAAKIVDWSEESRIPEARVIQIFGRGSDIEAQIAAILFENAIDASEFSAEVLSCLPHSPWEIPQEELQSRKDLRNLCIFTIDPATATDLDDALSVQRLSNDVFRVGVHIADVSYFVLPDTPLDIDAQIRSTSVYLLQSKLPMLPPMLSENLASLNPGVDRLAFSIFWDINSAGEVLDRWIDRTIIQSCTKLSYEHAQKIIEGSFENDYPHLYGKFEWSDVIKSVKNLHEISKVLKENRFKSGALSLESPKLVFLFDEEGIPYDSLLAGRINSNFLVEEFMLLANRTAAEVITRAYPSCALLRRHPEPNVRKLREFESFCNKHGLKLDISSSSHLHNSLEHIKEELTCDSALFDILMSYAVRPMQLAEYFCSGDSKDTNSDRCHYGLAVPLYTHFTSPLRRYPDIVVHRTLAAAIKAEDIYLKGKRISRNLTEEKVLNRCFTGVHLDRDAIESVEAQEALFISSSKYRVPCTKTLADVASHCNEKKLAARRVKDAMDKLYTWVLLKKKEILYSEARVLGLGPRFMSIYIPKLAIERRIHYDEVEGLTVEWLEATSTLMLSQSTKHKRPNRKSSPGKSRTLEEVALIVNPIEMVFSQHCGVEEHIGSGDVSEVISQEPAVFPLTVHLLSTIPVALHAIGGDDGPLDIVARLYLSSYFH